MNCRRCDGVGQVQHFGGGLRKCSPCEGTGSFPTLESQQSGIMKLLKGRKGLRTSRPKYAPERASHEVRAMHHRAYYIWRMARFHGGVDMRQPVLASLDVIGDPERYALDKLSDQVARDNFGTDMAAANKWSKALGF